MLLDETKRIDMVMALMRKATVINGMFGRSSDRTGNLPTVFYSFSGNCANVEFRICRNGWEMGGKSKYEHIEVDMDWLPDAFLQRCTEIEHWLDSIMAEQINKRGKQHEAI